mmetsp:Transcript_3808/g.10317  ORF Transcript_3808/g.10317 Transcript_3808/m.10317 type:complete len:208 (+) Transcript_3808:2720-3343(+)
MITLIFWAFWSCYTGLLCCSCSALHPRNAGFEAFNLCTHMVDVLLDLKPHLSKNLHCFKACFKPCQLLFDHIQTLLELPSHLIQHECQLLVLQTALPYLVVRTHCLHVGLMCRRHTLDGCLHNCEALQDREIFACAGLLACHEACYPARLLACSLCCLDQSLLGFRTTCFSANCLSNSQVSSITGLVASCFKPRRVLLLLGFFEPGL